MAKAFLSHSSSQKTLIENIGKRLGLDNCVIDKYHFAAGDPTLEEIFKGIDTCDLFVIFLSDDALNSSWVKREIEYVKGITDSELRKRIQIFLVDPIISRKDIRIPLWLSEQYNLKPIYDEILLYKKIDSKLRDIAIEKYPFIRKKEEIFVGRNQLMEEFEGKYYNLNNTKPSCIIASGFEEVGRRKFLKNALDKAKKLNKFHEQISITLDSRDSIEDFILRIEDLNSRKSDEIIDKIKDIDLEAKIQYAKELLLSFQEQNELLFIIDKGCIIQPNKQIASWFDKIITQNDFKNITSVCLISTMRPLSYVIRSKTRYLTFHVGELNAIDSRILFIRYCNELFGIEPQIEISNMLLPILNGMPGQIFYASELLHTEGSEYITNKFDEIRKYNDIHVYTVIEQIRTEGSLFFDLLVFIANVEFVSFNLMYKVFGKSKEILEIIEKLYVYGIYNYVGVDKEYLQIHYAIADYIKRKRIKLSINTKQSLKREISILLKEGFDYPDISQVLLALKDLVEDNKPIPENYLLPSFILRSIIDCYYSNQYKTVEVLAERILSHNSNYDPSIIREIRYWFCQSLARQFTKNKYSEHDKFFQQLEYFEGSDYHFLLGFYQRLLGEMPDARISFRRALQLDPYSQKSKRELVNVLLCQNDYEGALAIAADNYNRKPLNAFHAQAYFICLTRKQNLNSHDKKTLMDIMASTKMSHDYKADEIYSCMEGEFKFYVEDNLTGAIQSLQKTIKESNFSNYPKRALLEIYRKRGFKAQSDQLTKEIHQSNGYESFID